MKKKWEAHQGPRNPGCSEVQKKVPAKTLTRISKRKQTVRERSAKKIRTCSEKTYKVGEKSPELHGSPHDSHKG